MLAAGNVTVTDLLCGTRLRIPDGAHAMTQIIEIPPADPGVQPHRHSGPVFGYVLEGSILFELEGEAARKIVAGEAFWESGGDVVHYAPGVDMITMLDPDEIKARDHLRDPEARQIRNG